MKALVLWSSLLISMAGHATEIVVEPVHYAGQLSGKVIDPTGAPVSNVSVDLIPCGAGVFKGSFLAKKQELARTKSDGRFVIRTWDHNVRTCLSFSREGFNYHQFELKYKPGADPFVVKLTIAD